MQLIFQVACKYIDYTSSWLQGKLYTIMEICRMFDSIYKEHLDGVYVSNI